MLFHRFDLLLIFDVADWNEFLPGRGMALPENKKQREVI